MYCDLGLQLRIDLIMYLRFPLTRPSLPSSALSFFHFISGSFLSLILSFLPSLCSLPPVPLHLAFASLLPDSLLCVSYAVGQKASSHHWACDLALYFPGILSAHPANAAGCKNVLLQLPKRCILIPLTRLKAVVIIVCIFSSKMLLHPSRDVDEFSL